MEDALKRVREAESAAARAAEEAAAAAAEVRLHGVALSSSHVHGRAAFKQPLGQLWLLLRPGECHGTCGPSYCVRKPTAWASASCLQATSTDTLGAMGSLICVPSIILQRAGQGAACIDSVYQNTEGIPWAPAMKSLCVSPV